MVSSRFSSYRPSARQRAALTPIAIQTDSPVWPAASFGVMPTVPLDVWATDDAIMITAALPGMAPDALDLSVVGNTVTLSGTISGVAKQDVPKNATWYVQEMRAGSFRRTIQLPFDVDADGADAEFANGLLRVRLPKAHHARPHRLEIRTGRLQEQEQEQDHSDAIEAASTTRTQA